jgi:hypothetical protein
MPEGNACMSFHCRYSVRSTSSSSKQFRPAGAATVMLEDLEGSLLEIISTKASSSVAAAQQGSQPFPFNAAPKAEQQWQQAPPAPTAQQQWQRAPPTPAAPAIKTNTAREARASTAARVAPVVEEVQKPPPATSRDVGKADFGGLSHAFLKDMQSGLERLGYDLTSTHVVKVCMR